MDENLNEWHGWLQERKNYQKSAKVEEVAWHLLHYIFQRHPTPMKRRETFLSYKLWQHSTDPASHPKEKEGMRSNLCVSEEKCVVIIGKCQINVLRSIFSNLFAFTTWSMLFRGLYPLVYPLLARISFSPQQPPSDK